MAPPLGVAVEGLDLGPGVEVEAGPMMLSIDQSTPPYPIDAGHDLCTNVPRNMNAVCTNP